MHSVSDAPRNSAGASAPRTRHVCPFCGTLNDTPVGPCAKCTMQNTPQTRRVTRGRIGPWYVLQSRNPAAPGMKFDVLVGFIRKGQVTARSIVRGPTTHQFWRYAAHVKGLSREFGLCYACGVDISTESNLCPHCGKLQEPPINPDVLLEGAAPVARPVNGHVTATVSAVPGEAAGIPDMVDAEVVIPKAHNGRAAATPTATRVVIEPLVEPEPPLAEPEPISEPEHPHRGGNGYGRSNGHSNGRHHGNGNGNGHAAVHTPTVDADPPRVTEQPSADAGALMSPNDLAAAFHMKFAPVAEFDHQDPPKAASRWLRATIVVMLLLMIGATAAGAILFPDERGEAVDKIVTAWDASIKWVGNLISPPAPARRVTTGV